MRFINMRLSQEFTKLHFNAIKIVSDSQTIKNPLTPPLKKKGLKKL